MLRISDAVDTDKETEAYMETEKYLIHADYSASNLQRECPSVGGGSAAADYSGDYVSFVCVD